MPKPKESDSISHNITFDILADSKKTADDGENTLEIFIEDIGIDPEIPKKRVIHARDCNSCELGTCPDDCFWNDADDDLLD